MKPILAFVVVELAAGAAMGGEPAKPALNPTVTRAKIAETICATGWTRTVRPYVSDMKRIKAEMLAAIGEPIERRNRYELDHIVPLALGGALIDRRNLALQPIDEAREKEYPFGGGRLPLRSDLAERSLLRALIRARLRVAHGPFYFADRSR
ncbi:hypothetical protein K9U33_19420, partial [Rhodoblastus acidophilus]|nr:hypothetical protein [Candidatus Rhodoblastus alkanivorans]